MSDSIDQRDFFISFNSADLAYATAIDAALRAEGFTTFYHPRDLQPGGNIPMWMDDALMNSAQTLALYSPDYTNDKAIYSKAERYATWWQDPGSDKRKLIPILLRDTTFTPLMAMISRIEVTGLTPKEAATRVVTRLKAPDEPSSGAAGSGCSPCRRCSRRRTVRTRISPAGSKRWKLYTGRLAPMQPSQSRPSPVSAASAKPRSPPNIVIASAGSTAGFGRSVPRNRR
jgi:hypothetical protein